MKLKRIAAAAAALLLIAAAGIAAAETVPTDLPETVYLEYAYSGTEIPEQTMRVYYKLPDVRVEMSAYGTENVVIYNTAMGETYTYMTGNPMGMRAVFDAEEGVDLGMPVDLEPSSLIPDENTQATSVTLPNGEKALYMEMTDGTATQKMWFHPEYALVLRVEIYENGALTVTFEVTSLEINPNFDQSLFEPPADIQFIDLDMTDMTDLS